MGAGAQSCGAWLDSRVDVYHPKYDMEGWVLGFVSAMNMETEGKYDALEWPTRVDAAAIFSWLDKHCRQFPTRSIANALEVFMILPLERNR